MDNNEEAVNIKKIADAAQGLVELNWDDSIDEDGDFIVDIDSNHCLLYWFDQNCEICQNIVNFLRVVDPKKILAMANELEVYRKTV